MMSLVQSVASAAGASEAAGGEADHGTQEVGDAAHGHDPGKPQGDEPGELLEPSGGIAAQ